MCYADDSHLFLFWGFSLGSTNIKKGFDERLWLAPNCLHFDIFIVGFLNENMDGINTRKNVYVDHEHAHKTKQASCLCMSYIYVSQC